MKLLTSKLIAHLRTIKKSASITYLAEYANTTTAQVNKWLTGHDLVITSAENGELHYSAVPLTIDHVFNYFTTMCRKNDTSDIALQLSCTKLNLTQIVESSDILKIVKRGNTLSLQLKAPPQPKKSRMEGQYKPSQSMQLAKARCRELYEGNGFKTLSSNVAENASWH